MSLKATILDESVLHEFNGGGNMYNPPQEDIPKNRSQMKQRLLSNPLDGKDHVRKAFSDVYKGIVLTKTNNWEQEPYGNYGIYKARLNSYTAGDNKVIIAIVPGDENVPLGSTKLIDTLKWISFQTREIQNTKKDLNGFNLPLQNYMITNNSILHDRIKAVNETNTKVIYKSSNLPVKIEILKFRDDDHFSDEGTIWSALEVFSTIIVLE